MNYDLDQVVQGPIDDMYDREAMSYGSMPTDMLSSKFEETLAMPVEDVVNDYSRNLLTDRRPDPIGVASEEPRGSTERSSGLLRLRYEGHRGTAYTPYRPEYFDGFMGDEDRETRGTNVDPDSRELVKQEQARMRFIRFSPDGSDQVTSGGLSEAQVMENQQKVFRVVRGKLRIFDRQLDGRREGLRRTYEHKSAYSNQQGSVRGYGDAITDYALTPQRRANLICKQVLRDTPAWRTETIEDNFAIAQYGQQGRRAKDRVTHKTVAEALDSADGHFSDADASRCYKTAGILMSNIVRGKKQCVDAMRTGDIDMSDATLTVARKTETMVRDLTVITRQISQDGEFHATDNTLVGKNPGQVQAAHLTRRITYNHSVSAHHYLNTELMYKSVKPGADTRRIKNDIITDATAPEVRDMDTVVAKTAKRNALSGAKLSTADDTDKAESTRTVNYKHVKQTCGDKRSRLTSADGYAGVSDNSQVRRPAKWNYRVESPNDTITTSEFGSNASKERHGGAMGSKYMNRFIDRDGKQDEGLMEVY